MLNEERKMMVAGLPYSREGVKDALGIWKLGKASESSLLLLSFVWICVCECYFKTDILPQLVKITNLIFLFRNI